MVLVQSCFLDNIKDIAINFSNVSITSVYGSMSLLHLFYRLKTDSVHDKVNVGDQGIHFEETCELTLTVIKSYHELTV